MKMDKFVIAETLLQCELYHYDNDFVYLKHKLYQIGNKHMIKTPKWLVGKWEPIIEIQAQDINLAKKGVKTLFKVPLNTYEGLVVYYQYIKDNFFLGSFDGFDGLEKTFKLLERVKN